MGNQQSALHDAAAHNDVAKVESLFLHQHANVNDRDKDDWTPLHFAAYGGGLEVTQALLLRGANPEPRDKAGRTPLHLAALQGHTTLASLLIGRGAHVEVQDENQLTPLHKAALKVQPIGGSQIFFPLLREGRQSFTEGQTDVGEQLLRLGADVNARVKDGTTALHLASWKNHPEFVKLLLAHGADVRAVTKSGQTPLHDAAKSGNTDIAQMLLSLGANVLVKDEDRDTAAQLAQKEGNQKFVDFLGHGGAPSQGASVAPSAPPMPSGGPVRYPDIYQPKPDEKTAEQLRNQDFWNENLDEKDKEKAGNADFWGDAMGSSKPAPQQRSIPKNEREAEYNRNKQFWDNQLEGGLDNVQQARQNWYDSVRNAQQAWDNQMGGQQGAPKKKHPREEFQDNLLKQAAGLWNVLQGKGGHDDSGRRQQQPQPSHQAEDGWGPQAAKPTAVPSQEKYDLEPYDEDDYQVEPKQKPQQRTAQDLAGARRRIAELELQLDREEGWIRGGTKSEASDAKARRDRIKEQESEIAALKKQLDSSKEIMHDPVTAGDGYTYEKGPIEQWIKSGHNTSPMTGGPLGGKNLTPNYSLRSSIKEWQSSRH